MIGKTLGVIRANFPVINTGFMNIKQIFVSGIRRTIPLSITSTTILGTIVAVAIPSSDVQTAIITTKNPTSNVNLRLAPTTQSDAVDYGKSGDRVIIRNHTQGMDGYIWYYVKLQESGITGWVRGDLIARGNRDKSIQNTRNITIPIPLENYYPRNTKIPTSLSRGEEIRSRNLQRKESNYRNNQEFQDFQEFKKNQQPPQAYFPQRRYTAEEINYFMEIALGAEFSTSSSIIRKWEGDLRIKIIGSPTSEDLNTLKTVINEINHLVSNINLKIVDNQPNVKIHFIPVSQFQRYEPNYRPGNYGYAWIKWKQNNIINSANILITTTGVSQKERSHLIREELTQSLGLLKDSYQYKNSIFYQPWTDTNQYSQLDKKIIQMLYQPEIRPGMTKSQVISSLKKNLKGI